MNEIPFQIRNFTCCLNLRLNLKMLKINMYGNRCRPDWTFHVVNTADASSIRDIKSKGIDTLML